MTIVGRITKDAVVNTLKDDRKVVNFSIAINESYKPKGRERVKVTTFCNCSYWLNQKMAEHLKKGTLVEAAGRIYVAPYVGKDGTAKASLNCHVNSLKIHAWPKEVDVIGTATQNAFANDTGSDDDPF
ncbi:single-stranded DNA-binding protein [Flavisolibacter nicotianae]|uniref:single-stranded DNA-binding protein n=1 Tax=Flavisolibacter nicotianae TaxID=2364882 RepID=UPI000EB09FF9|nr:single-stranded DNA-binding protein [Flavisolibacter nicotianae]